MPDEVLPEYVPRDTDAAGSGVRAKLAAAAERGGFVLLVGGSSVGKTRCAAEAVRALLPDWWLVHPGGPAEVAALAAAPPERTVVWLDELQRYLDGKGGMADGTVRALLGASGPGGDHRDAVAGPVPHLHRRARARRPGPARAGTGSAGHGRGHPISPRFSPAEQERARAAATRDPRLREALGAAGYGLTQTLAAAPQLVARWQDAQAVDPYAWAVLTAALDVARLGARAPLSTDLLRAAAPGYCTSAQQAEAPGNWFEQALAYATAKLHGAAAALAPAGTGMGEVAGYTVADYLIQHASRERRYARVPASTWDAVLSHIRDPADTARLADSARRRLLYRYAIPLYRHAADAGDEDAAGRLAELLQRRGDLDGLRAAADAGDEDAAGRLAGLLDERGDLDGLRARADAGDERRRQRLVELLAGRGDLDGLRARADAGDEAAARQLAKLLAEARRPGRGRTDPARPSRRRRPGRRPASWPICSRSAATWTRPRRSCAPGPTLATGPPPAAGRAARGARRPGRARAPGPTPATRRPPMRLAGLLAERGDLDEAQICAPGPTPATEDAAGGWPSCWPSAATWTGCAPAPTPATAMPPGGWPSCWPSAATWTGCAPGPTPATSTPPGGWPSCWPSAATWTGPLRIRADAGDWDAAGRLAELLARARRPGRAARPGRRRRRGCRRAAGRAARRARRPGRGRQILRAPADAGDWNAARRLAELLEERGDLDEAAQTARADAGDGTPPGGWPICWPSAATWTGCAPGQTPATRRPPGGWPICWSSAATWTRPRRSCAPGPTPATGAPPGGWPTAGPARRPGRAARPDRRRRRRGRRAAGQAADRAGPG